jgi:predicted nucleic acid-binding protein
MIIIYTVHQRNERPDKTWGFTDCISFVVMREEGLTDAVTADVHFVQAGFRALLRE